MYDKCMYDRDEQCFHDCPDCVRREIPEPDWDILRELLNGDREEERMSHAEL